MSATANLFFSERGEPALDLVEPRSRGWCEMHMEPRVTGKPIADGGGLVRTVVIHHQVNVQVIRNRCLDRAQEFQKLAAAMTSMQLPDDFAGGDVECSKQGRRAMTLVVMRAPFGNAGRQRQYRLSPVQSLNLALLVNAQHHGLEWWVKIKPDDVSGLLDKQRVGGQLERFLAMRLQTEGAPDAADRRLRQLCFARHGARAPVRGVRRRFLQCLGNHAINTRVINRARRSRARGIEQTVQAHLYKPGAPFRYRLPRHRQLGRDGLVFRSARTCQDDTRTQGQRLRRLAPSRPGMQLFLFGCAQHQLRFWSACHAVLAMKINMHRTTDLQNNSMNF